VATAGVILFPLAPDRLLVMMRNDLALAHDLNAYADGRILYDDLDHAETLEVCRDIVMSAARWAFERPKATVASRFEVPPLPQAAAFEE
jgi:hypothetical protein